MDFWCWSSEAELWSWQIQMGTLEMLLLMGRNMEVF